MNNKYLNDWFAHGTEVRSRDFRTPHGDPQLIVFTDTNEQIPKNEQVRIAKQIAAAPLLLEALKFYANPQNWKEIETGIGMFPADANDYGHTARKALKEIEPELIQGYETVIHGE